MKIRGFAALAALAVCAPPAVFACGSSANGSGVSAAKLPPSGSRDESLAHEQCNESGNRVEQLDTNNDGKPDIRRIFDKGGHELCRVVDLNHDGHPDLYEYFDAGGNVRRREFCYDDTGVVNAIEYYDGGKLSRREYDTTGMHKIDTWDYFDGAPVDAKSGRPTHPTRRERDTTGDGRVDQWWTWSGDNVTIAVDTNGDGKPDPASQLTLDKSGQAMGSASAQDNGAPPPAASSAAPAASSSALAGQAAAPAASSTAAAAASTAPADGGKP
jgi:hypothetical protein